jgi:hypothetical protein
MPLERNRQLGRLSQTSPTYTPAAVSRFLGYVCAHLWCVAGGSSVTDLLKFTVRLALLATLVLSSPALATSADPRAQAAHRPAGPTLRLVATVNLPGPSGRRFDYLAVDEDDDYLFATHLGAGLLYVIDLKTNGVVKVIPDLPGISGLAYIPEFGKLYTSDWWENKIAVIDLRQLKVTKKLATEEKPDGIAYAAPFRKAYVSNERAKALTIVDVRDDRIIKALHFDSETGVPQYDPVARKIYVNLQDINALAIIDPVTDTLIAQYRVEGCERNHGMALDPEHRRAFLACEGNDLLTVVNLETYKAVAQIALPSGADVVQFDPALGRIYVACSSGFISVIHEDDPDHFRKLEDFAVEKKVHSLAVDQRTHRVYAPLEQEHGRPAAKMVVFDALVSSGSPGP